MHRSHSSSWSWPLTVFFLVACVCTGKGLHAPGSLCGSGLWGQGCLRLRGSGREVSADAGNFRNPEALGLMTDQGLFVRSSGAASEENLPNATADGVDFMSDGGEERGAEEIPEEQKRKNKRLWQAVKDGDDVGIESIVREGADVESTDAEYGGWTAMHYAAQSGRSRIVQCLLRFGAKVDSRNERGSTPLSIAAAEGHLCTVRKLVARGAQVDAGNEFGVTPLHRAASAGCSKTCEKLIALGADVNASNHLEVTALHRSTASGHLDTTELLLSLGADVHAANSDGWTALHYAAQNGELEVVEVLLAAGAKTMAVTLLQELPADKAHRFGHNRTTQLLVKKAWVEEWGPSHMDTPKRDSAELQAEFDELWKDTWDDPTPAPAKSTQPATARKGKFDQDGVVLWEGGRREPQADSDAEISDAHLSSEQDGAWYGDRIEADVEEAMRTVSEEDRAVFNRFMKRMRRQIRRRLAEHKSSMPPGSEPDVFPWLSKVVATQEEMEEQDRHDEAEGAHPFEAEAVDAE